MDRYKRCLSERAQAQFWSRVDVTDTCWLWTAGLYGNGYGQFMGMRAHRVAWVLFNGYLPDDVLLLHDCDIKRCVSPLCTYPGTQLDNVRDSIRKGRFNQRRKLSEDDVRRIRNRIAQGEYRRTIAPDFGVNKGCIDKIAEGCTWAWL